MFDPRIALVQVREKYAAARLSPSPITAIRHADAKTNALLKPSSGMGHLIKAPNDTHEAWTGIAAKKPKFVKGELQRHLEGAEAPPEKLNFRRVAK